MGKLGNEMRRQKIHNKYVKICRDAVNKHPNQTADERDAMLVEIKRRFAKECERKGIKLCTSPK